MKVTEKMKKWYAVVAIALIAVLFSACGSHSESGSSKAAATVDSAGEKFNIIATPYANLRVTEEFEENITHEETAKEPYTLTFSSKKDNTELFSLIFNGKGKTLFGTIVGEDANTVVYITLAELDENSDNYEINRANQSKLKDVLNCLTADYEIILDQEVDHAITSNFEIKTPLVTLKYPNKWKDKVKVEVTEDSVKFSDNGTPVFDLVFKETKGYLLGTYNGTPVYMVEHPVKNDEQAAMQQDVNVILKYLMKDPNFKM